MKFGIRTLPSVLYNLVAKWKKGDAAAITSSKKLNGARKAHNGYDDLQVARSLLIKVNNYCNVQKMLVDVLIRLRLFPLSALAGSRSCKYY